jgi:hypothetical protein
MSDDVLAASLAEVARVEAEVLKPAPSPRSTHRFQARVRIVSLVRSLASAILRRKFTSIRVSTLDGPVTVSVPRSIVEGQYVRFRVVSGGSSAVICSVPDGGKTRLLSFPRDQVEVTEV